MAKNNADQSWIQEKVEYYQLIFCVYIFCNGDYDWITTAKVSKAFVSDIFLRFLTL